MSFQVALTVITFLLYWIFGGVVFSIITALRLGRVQKTRFGCLFSSVSLGLAIIAAASGVTLAENQIARCQLSPSRWISWIESFACGIIPIMSVMFIGFLILILVGVFLMYISTISESDQPEWIEQTLPEDHEEPMGEYEHTEEDHTK